jgi:hypothetical protein
MFFVVAAYLLLDRYLTRGGSRLGFHLMVVLGVLSHLTFLMAYGGFAGWSAVHLRKERDGVKRFADLHAPILAFLIALYFLAVKGMLIGGGVNNRPGYVIGALAHWVLGVPENCWWAIVPIAIACVWECVRMYREGRSEWAFFAGALVTALVAIPAWGLSCLTPRYLAVLVPPLFLLLARFVCRLRWAGVALLLAFLAAQAALLSQFYAYGRGDYSGAAALLSSAGGTVGADPTTPAGDFRVGLTLWYYGPAIRFIDRPGWKKGAPDWMIACDFQQSPATPAHYLERNGARFEFVRLFRASGTTTPVHWILYRRIGLAGHPDRT